MAQMKRKAKRRKGQGNKAASQKPKERRFSTSTTYIAPWIAGVGMLGALVLGAGVFGLWIVDPAISWASYLVAAGGLGLGIALWFGQPSESAVAVGDAGIAVEDGRDVVRVPWCDMESLSIVGTSMVARGASATARFSLGANQKAAAWALKEAAERMPDVVDVEKAATEKLPKPSEDSGLVQDVEDAQVAGAHCAASDEPIKLEEEARLCPRCGQVYHESSVPDECVTCEAELKGRTLRI